MDNPEKPATQGTQDEEKQSQNTTHYVVDTTIRKQTQTRDDLVTIADIGYPVRHDLVTIADIGYPVRHDLVTIADIGYPVRHDLSDHS
jgi:hypothetical protein